eukprot:2025760-Prymnesium_polylepis.1
MGGLPILMTAQGPPVFSTQGTCVDHVTAEGKLVALILCLDLGTVIFKSPLMSDYLGISSSRGANRTKHRSVLTVPPHQTCATSATAAALR